MRFLPINFVTIEYIFIFRENIAQKPFQGDECHALEIFQKLLLDVFWLEIFTVELLLGRSEELPEEHHIKLSVALFRDVLILVAP